MAGYYDQDLKYDIIEANEKQGKGARQVWQNKKT